MKISTFRRFLIAAVLAVSTSVCCIPGFAVAQDNWAADDDSFEARKIERYQQLVDQSPEKSYAFTQLMNTVGKGAQYQQLLKTYEKKVADKPNNFNLRMILGHMYQYGGRTNEAIEAYKKAIDIKKTPLAYMSIAAAEAENKNFEPAVANYEAAANLNPSKEQKQEIWRELAEIAIYRRDMTRAKTCFDELIKLEPNSLFVRRELAQIYTENRLYDEARDVLTQAAKLSSASAAEKEQIEFDIAELYELEGKDSEALPRYEALSSKLASSHWMQRELTARIIDIHRRNGNISELADVLEKKWKNPTYQQHLELADLFDETGKPDKALAHIQKAISSSPKLPEAHEKLVRFYRSHGQIEKMFEAKNALIKAVPDNPEYRFELYEAYIQQKKTDKALTVLDEIQKKFASDFDVQRRVAELYQINGRNQKALNIFETWAKKNPNDLQALEALGDQYDASGDKKKAIATWKKIESLNIDKATKLETLARIYDEHGYADEAESLYAKAISASPSDCQIYQMYADVLTRNGKQVQAIEAWQKLVSVCKTTPVRSLAARQLASLYSARGNQSNAIKQYRGQCEASPNSLDNVLMFASLANALNMSSEAIPTLEAFIERNPSQTEALNALNELYASSGDLDAARKTLEKLSSVSEVDRRDALIAMADLDVQSGDLEAAQNHLSEALKLNANDADTHEKLGDILVKRRLYDEAANNYATAFQIDNRNFAVAFKDATCLSILGKTKDADDLYVQIITNSTDEALAHKAARRAIDDHAYLGTLDALANSLLPLLRSSQRKALYLEILLSLADAQAQPYTLELLTKDAQHSLSARHALRELGEKYASLIVESLLYNDPAISARALALSEWMSSSNVIGVLGQMIEKAPTSEMGRQTQLQAVRAIAHAQLPAAVPVLKECMDSRNSRALREHAIWALGLIQSQSATDALYEALDINFDTFRALAIIGLGRQNQGLDKIHALLKSDPSNVVLDAAAWMLAFRHYEKAYADIIKFYNVENLKPHQLWALSVVDERNSTPVVLRSLWCSSNRTMAASIIRSVPKEADLASMSLAEAQGKFITNASSHYQTNFNLDLLLEHFSMLAMNDTGSPALWMNAHRAEFATSAMKIAQGTIHPKEGAGNSCQQQMLRDLVVPSGLAKFDVSDDSQQAILSETAQSIASELISWLGKTDTRENRTLAGLSLRALALTKSSDALNEAKKVAQSGDNMALRLDAVDAIAAVQTADSRKIIRDLAQNENYLIRAAAVSHLSAGDKDDRTVLEKSVKDEYAVVSQTASSILNR